MDRWKSAELLDKYDKRIPGLTAFVLWAEAVFITAYFNELLYVTAIFSLPDKKFGYRADNSYLWQSCE